MFYVEKIGPSEKLNADTPVLSFLLQPVAM